MIKDRLFMLLLSVLGFSDSSLAQQPLLAKYVIVTFEDTYKISQHGTQTYYWIIPQDSIKSNDNLLSHLFLEDFSKNNFIDCCNGKDIDPSLVVQNTSYTFDPAYYKSIDELEQIVVNHRKRLQIINKRWQSGQKEDITIFATPVLGKFCSSDFHPIGQRRYGYKGKVYIPYSSFTYSEKFWKSAEAEFVLNQDFSKIKFDIIPN